MGAEHIMKRILLAFSLLLLFACAPSPQIPKRNIYYIGGDNKVKATLIRAGYNLVEEFEKADVFVLNGEIPDVNAIATKLRSGAGLVLISGKEMSFRDVEVLFDYPVTALIPSEDPVNLVADEYFAKNDPLVKEINWSEAPQVRERAFIMGMLGNPIIRVDGYNEVVIGKDAEKIFSIDIFLDNQHNLQFQEWKYFDYLIYHLVERAAGAEPMSYADYSK